MTDHDPEKMVAEGASPHVAERKAMGKYDCIFDSYVHADLGRDIDFTGSDEYGIVTQKLELNEDLIPEHELIELIGHYGSSFLLLQEDSQGLVVVVAFADQASLDAEYERMEADYTKWLDAVEGDA